MALTSGIRVIGLENVLSTLNNQITKIPFRTLKGMIAAGLTVQRRAQKLTPINLGNLKASAFTTWKTKRGGTGGNFKGDNASEMKQEKEEVMTKSKAGLNSNAFSYPQVEVGFTANYAIYVHEDLEAAHKVGQSKFLQQAFASGMQDILKAIRTEAVVKGSD